MPTLRELDGEFLKREPFIDTWQRQLPDGSLEEVTGMREAMRTGVPFTDADGVMFLCPKCFAANGGSVGTHRVICWFVGKVPDDVDPKPGRWVPEGTGLDDLTFVGPAAASVLLTSGCGWHGFVSRGSAA